MRKRGRVESGKCPRCLRTKGEYHKEWCGAKGARMTAAAQEPGAERGRVARNGQDPLVVRTEDMLPYIMHWVERHTLAHPSPVSVGRPSKTSAGMEALAERTGIHQLTVRGYLANPPQWTTLHRADQLLSAIGRPDLLYSAIQVVPNPGWTEAHWHDVMAQRGWCFDEAGHEDEAGSF